MVKLMKVVLIAVDYGGFLIAIDGLDVQSI